MNDEFSNWVAKEKPFQVAFVLTIARLQWFFYAHLCITLIYHFELWRFLTGMVIYILVNTFLRNWFKGMQQQYKGR